MLREARFVYAVPNFSNPTGVLVPQDQRAALLERVVRAGTWLVEDDPYLVLQLDEPVGPGLLGLDVAGARRRGPTTARWCTSARCPRASRPGCGSAGRSRDRR